MQLCKNAIEKLRTHPDLEVPALSVFDLPEKVLQFGTGVLLRGLPAYFIDKANRQGIFNGRILVVKSTSQGTTDEFATQDGLYTIVVRGIEEDQQVEENIICSSISRVLTASSEWNEILKSAANPDMQVVISNTTELGIVLTDDDIHTDPPSSFPGKLVSFLYKRFKAFNGDPNMGMVILPAELISDNGARLKEIVLKLAEQNKLEDDFIHWLETANHFCNTLVDRIVPGRLPEHEKNKLEEELGYTDDLMIMAESFRLWAIESSDERVTNILSFAKADNGLIITDDIAKFKELKLRLLNGTHTFSCGLAFLAGFDTVKDAMQDPDMAGFVRRLMMLEIASSLNNEVSYNEACAFANRVMDRFRNPSLDHRWLSITMNYSSKMMMRNVPLLQNFPIDDAIPANMALGFAAFLLFMKGSRDKDGKYFGTRSGVKYRIDDENAEYFSNLWAQHDVPAFVRTALGEKKIWETDLNEINGFTDLVSDYLRMLITHGALETIRQTAVMKSMA